MDKPRSMWMVMTTIIKPNQTATSEEIETINSWMLSRWLSNNQFTTPIANVLNRYSLSKEIEYKFANTYCQLVDIYGKVSFIQYKTEKNPEMLQRVLDNIKRKYKVNEQEAKQYFRLMTSDQKDQMMDMYKEQE